MTKLGRLERVDLRSEWAKEDRDFTPWLAREENIALLGETLKMSLEVEEEERQVGRFSADILCKDIASSDGDWVVIENQLEKTDHSHLGQILTYSAGLEAKTCIWVAEKFHDEHRAAIDWLNEISSDDHQFFGLEIELWKIGDSVAAPKFNIIAKPNDWKRDIGRVSKSIKSSALSPAKKLQLNFWEALNEKLDGHDFLNARKPRAQNWASFSIGKSGMNLAALVNTRDKRVSVELYFSDEKANAYFEELLIFKENIEQSIGLELEWQPLPNKRACRIITHTAAEDLANRDTWPELIDWHIDTLGCFRKEFSPRVKLLSGEYEE